MSSDSDTSWGAGGVEGPGGLGRIALVPLDFAPDGSGSDPGRPAAGRPADAIDPDGIIAPGRGGVWPRRFRK